MRNLEFVSVEAFNAQVKRVEELEHIAELAMEWSAQWSAQYPLGKRSWKTNARIADMIYNACEKAGIGQAEKDSTCGSCGASWQYGRDGGMYAELAYPKEKND